MIDVAARLRTRRAGRNGWAVLAVLAIAVASIAMATSSASGAGRSALSAGRTLTVHARSMTLTEKCQDVVFMGARGSAEPSDSGEGMGLPVYNAFRSSLSYGRAVTGQPAG